MQLNFLYYKLNVFIDCYLYRKKKKINNNKPNNKKINFHKKTQV